MNKTIFRKILEKLLGYIFIGLSTVLPKKNIYLFAGQHGKRVFDNSKYLFDYFIAQNNHDIHVYWFYTAETKELQLIPERYRVKSHSLKGILLALQAKAAFVSYTAADFGLIRFSHKTIFVQLWHGIPLKTIFYGIKYNTTKSHVSYQMELARYNYFVASSDIENKILQDQLKVPKSRILQSGYPRNDILKASKITRPSSISNILFAPTFRETGFSPIQSLSGQDWDKLSALLTQHNITLTIRSHAVEFFKDVNANIQSKLSNHPKIVFANSDEYPDVQQLMLNSDCLISDYSGIIIDYLLLEKPIIRFMPDYDEYSEYRGLNQYEGLYIGKNIKLFDDLLRELNRLIHSPNLQQEKLSLSKSFFHSPTMASTLIYDDITK
ncbi:hypothetical protein HND96_01940 [Proteus terrae subsp. cibarius]|uniref:CDP-glycerol glycerophosphotransferase family protein n=1 Tax=Proteus terrae TaxID=1574161 RepID=UPI00131FD6A7|nr:CDP-glycerol glycerophosphotransferase family protein [Proteus terrae]QHD94450.1 hypothetical protein GSM99_07745 [Proteus terrae subsp. cibarius]QJW49726.1 hypothetical protein HND96_01940 [Proteus terrae subsp. cibarius]